MSANHSQDGDHIHHPQTFPLALYNLSLPPPRLPNTDVRSIIIDLFAFSRVKWSRTGCVFFFCLFVCLFFLSFSSHSIIINKKLGLHNKQLFNISFLEEISLIYKIIPNNSFIIQKIETDLFYQ